MRHLIQKRNHPRIERESPTWNVGSAGAAGNQGGSIQIHATMMAPLQGLSAEVAG
jgi:hypothetical protein